jgi:DNA-binding MarR family transcriptional regulator
MDARLRRSHGLTLNDYEVLLHLSWAPDHRMRPVDLAQGVLLTQGGITRLLDGLERAGLIERVGCCDDARVKYAQLTDAGRDRVTKAAARHVDDVRALFGDRFSGEELATFVSLLERLPGGVVAPERAHPVQPAP